MTLTDFYNEVSRHTDTATTQINAAETKRVLAVAFQVLAQQDTTTVLTLVTKGLEAAKKKASKG